MTYDRTHGAGDALPGGGAARTISEGASLIDQHSHFNGIYRSPRDLRIEGQFEGEIHCDGTVVVAEMARVSGTIEAGNVRISGAVDGRVTCVDRFEILTSGQVTAQVLAGTITIRHGAFYEGEMRMHQEPDGLPQREVTAAASSLERGPARGPNRRSGTEGGTRPAQAEPVAPEPEARDLPQTPALRAVPDA